MGELVEMMLDGILCQECGVYVGEECGYPKSCNECCEDESETDWKTKRKQSQERKRARLEDFRSNFNSTQWEEWTQLSPYHFRMVVNGKNLDYWPSTTRTHYDGKTHFLNSMHLKLFIKKLKEQKQ